MRRLWPGLAGARRPSGFVIAYAAMITGPVLLILLGFRMGGRQATAGPRAQAAAHGQATASLHTTASRFLLAVAIILVVTRMVGGVFPRLRQPRVAGEIVAGIVLGPSLLGLVWPGAAGWLFPADVLPFVQVLAQLGLILFMFLIGLELQTALIRGQGHVVVTVSHASIVVPFALGVLVALLLHPSLAPPAVAFTPFALFLGCSMSITAFPVLARILVEHGLYRTRLGTLSLTCAAVDDVTAWCLLAVVVVVARGTGLHSAVSTIVGSGVFVVAMLTVVRPLLCWFVARQQARGSSTGAVLPILVTGMLLSAFATDRIGIHPIFGAFLFGVITPSASTAMKELARKLEEFTVAVLLPLFFAYTGLRTSVGLLGASARLWLLCALVLLVAVAGKWAGSTVSARVAGLPWRESLSLGVLMNTRGLTELVILNVGLDLGIISPTVFTMLVIMALVTTLMAAPVLLALERCAPLEGAGERGAPPGYHAPGAVET